MLLPVTDHIDQSAIPVAPLKGELAAAQPLTEGFLFEPVQTSRKPLRRFAPRQIVKQVQQSRV